MSGEDNEPAYVLVLNRKQLLRLYASGYTGGMDKDNLANTIASAILNRPVTGDNYKARIEALNAVHREYAEVAEAYVNGPTPGDRDRE